MDPYKQEIRKLTSLYEKIPTDTEKNESNNYLSADSSVEELSEHDTVTEQEYLTEEEGTDEEVVESKGEKQTTDTENRSLYYRSKKGTKWRKTVPPRNVRTLQGKYYHAPARCQRRYAISNVTSSVLVAYV